MWEVKRTEVNFDGHHYKWLFKKRRGEGIEKEDEKGIKNGRKEGDRERGKGERREGEKGGEKETRKETKKVRSLTTRKRYMTRDWLLRLYLRGSGSWVIGFNLFSFVFSLNRLYSFRCERTMKSYCFLLVYCVNHYPVSHHPPSSLVVHFSDFENDFFCSKDSDHYSQILIDPLRIRVVDLVCLFTPIHFIVSKLRHTVQILLILDYVYYLDFYP